MKYAIEQRMRFIERHLARCGRINRADLMAKFRLSVAQTIHDLGRYRQMAPGNMAYDKWLKTYVRTDGFEPVFSERA